MTSLSTNADATAVAPANVGAVRAAWPETHLDRWMDPQGVDGLVSILVPTYNRAHLVVAALDSVREQTYRPIEVVVVDDGSTDGTGDVVAAWMDAHDDVDGLDVRYVRQENRGGSAARNRALVESRGAFIQFLDSDDILHPQKIQIHVDLLTADPPCAFVYSDLRGFVDGTEPPTPTFEVDPDATPIRDAADDRSGVPGNSTTGLYRRSQCACAGPWNETLTLWDDLEYNYRHVALLPTYRYQPGVLYFMRVHDGERLQDYSENVEGIEAGLRAANAMAETAQTVGLDAPEVKRQLANLYVNRFRSALRRGSKEQVRESMQRAIQQRPTLPFRMLLKSVYGVYRTLGGTAAKSALEAYSRLRTLGSGRKISTLMSENG